MMRAWLFACRFSRDLAKWHRIALRVRSVWRWVQ